MAKNTQKELFNSVIYSVYVRNHTPSGDFKGLADDLDRIADLGVDTIWLMPIHPIGEEGRKGSLGCPYSIKDYRSINEEYGTVDDFKNLIDKVHARSMKLIIDVVYNHTSKDSNLLKSNPEYFIKDENGNVMCKIDEWNDVADLDYSNAELWDELIDILHYWCSLGVDGFRCDVASFVPLEFWLKARKSIQEKYPNTVFLAESCGLDFIELVRSNNFEALTDSEIFMAFDMSYDYDIRDAYYFLVNKKDYYPADFAYRLFLQNNTYPQNAVKLRFLENHDNPRAAKISKNQYELNNYTAMMFFQRGAALVYAGQEVMETKTPSLFEKDLINLDVKDQEFYDYFKKLIELKKQDFFKDGFFYVKQCDDKNAVHMCYKQDDKIVNGVFNLNSKVHKIAINVTDGTYTNMINNKKVIVKNGKISKNDLPAYFISKA